MFKLLKEKLKNWITENKKEIVETGSAPINSKDESVRVQRAPTNSKDESVRVSKKLQKTTRKKVKVKKQSKDKPEQTLNEATEIPSEVKGFFMKFKKRLTEEKFEELFKELEIILLQNNVAYSAVKAIRESLGEKLIGKTLKEVNLSNELKNSIESILINPPNFLEEIRNSLEIKQPFVILFSGINGSGKTTTIAKMADYLQKNKLSVCLAAADTFRAAAIQQLEKHANKLKVPIVKKDYGTDPASVGFEAIVYAKKNKIDVVLIDTAGRMQNRDSLMKEIEKICRVNRPDMKIFLGESITGNDATEQAKAFDNSIGLTGIILSKADVDERGGTAISVSHVTGKPILFLGTGQKYEDLEIFDKNKIIEKLGL